LQELERSLLEKRVIEAREILQKHEYEVIQPRFYKEKKGRKTLLLHPWKSIKERKEAEEKGMELWIQWLKLYQEYYQKTGQRVPSQMNYKSIQTPDGERWIRI